MNRSPLTCLAAQLGITPRFVGFRKDVPKWLTAAHIATVPSRVEPLGNATLEAMAFGLPVIGGDTGGIPEMVIDGETGLLVTPACPDKLAAALNRLLTQPGVVADQGRQGRARCEKVFSLRCHVEEAVAVYLNVHSHCDSEVLSAPVARNRLGTSQRS